MNNLTHEWYMNLRRIYRRNGLSNERMNKYLQITYKTAAIPTIGSWRTFSYFWWRKVSCFSSFQDSSLRKSYEVYFKDKFKQSNERQRQISK